MMKPTQDPKFNHSPFSHVQDNDHNTLVMIFLEIYKLIMTMESRLSPAEQLHSRSCLSFLVEDDLCIHKRMCLGFERLNCNYLNRNVILFSAVLFCACYLLCTINIP